MMNNNWVYVQGMNRTQNGISLIDALIALVILSFGLLAITALQFMTKQSNYEAMQRSYASYMAYDLLERIRLNSMYPDAATTVQPISNYLNSAWLTNDVTESSTTGRDCDAGLAPPCNLAERANWDVLDWKKSLEGTSESSAINAAAGGLLDPTVCMSATGGQASGSPGQYTLVIAWRGQSSMKDSRDTGYCGDGQYGTDNEYRRALEIVTYLTDYKLK